MDLKIFDHEVDDKRRRLIDEPVNEDLIDKNKYANNSEYIPDSVYRRILNRITNYQWSFEPVAWGYEGEGKEKHAYFVGRLIVPGFGIHTGVGTASMNKKDNSNSLAVAKTFSFKNACKEMGLAPNVGDDEFDADLFERDVQEEIEQKAKEVEKGKGKKKKKDKKDKFDEEPKSIKAQIKELREAYELDNEDDLVAFLQIWDEEILDPDDLNDDDWKKFFKYLKKNPDAFEEF